MAAWLRRTGAALAIVVAALAAAGVVGAKGGSVHLRGTAYEFNNTKVLLGGATIRVAEDPRLRATTQARRHLRPRRSRPRDRDALHRCRRSPHDLPADLPYRRRGPRSRELPDADGRRCTARSPPCSPSRSTRTASCATARSSRPSARATSATSSFRGFTAYGAHGVAGATASGTPALPPATYFNDQVVPDPAQQRSSVDGGVVWTRVPAGTYRSARSIPRRASRASSPPARPGRIVNANPPWGLHELGKAQPATVSARWAGVRLRALRVAKLPPASVVRLRCTGRGCPFRARRVVAKRRDRRSARPARGARRRPRSACAPGQTLEVLVSAHAYDGKLVRWRLRSALAPRAVTWCVPLGNTRPRRHC